MASVQTNEGESFLARERANLFRGWEGVGGMITVTDKRIIFQPHMFNIQRDVVEIPLKDIVDVRERSTYGLINNGMLVKTGSGQEYKFVLNNREKIINLIKQHMGPLRTA